MAAAATPPNRQRKRRESPFSLYRLGVIAAVLGVVFIVGGAFLYNAFDRGSRQQPLDIARPAGAEQWGAEIPGYGASKRVVFRLPGTTDADVLNVVNFYNNQLVQHYNSANDPDAPRSERECVRSPLSGNFPEFDAGTANIAPYFYTCRFDRSYGDALQWTEIIIQPGIVSTDEGLNSEGYVVIQYDYRWTP
jgi:hypothetical protein